MKRTLSFYFFSSLWETTDGWFFTLSQTRTQQSCGLFNIWNRHGFRKQQANRSENLFPATGRWTKDSWICWRDLLKKRREAAQMKHSLHFYRCQDIDTAKLKSAEPGAVSANSIEVRPGSTVTQCRYRRDYRQVQGVWHIRVLGCKMSFYTTSDAGSTYHALMIGELPNPSKNTKQKTNKHSV